MIARIALVVIAVLFTLGFAFVMNRPAQSAEESQWDKWGVAPYARNLEEACRKAPEAIDGLNLPQAVKEDFKKKVTDSFCKGEKAYLTPDMVLEEMWTGGQKPHVMKNKKVAELPVLKSPEGRAYNKGSVVEAAVAYVWTSVHEGKIYYLFLPWVCYNWSTSIASTQSSQTKPLALPSATGIIAKCPEVYFLKVNVWERGALKLPGVEITHAKEESGQKQFAGVPHVSKTHGGQFRRAYAAGQLQRSSTAHAFRVSLIMTPESQGGAQNITADEVLGDIEVAGLYELQFTREQVGKWDAIRLVALKDGVVSPPRFSATGVHELRFFNRLPGKKLGEWDNNPDSDCLMNVHVIE